MRILSIFKIRKCFLKNNNLLFRRKWLELSKITFFFNVYKKRILQLIIKI